MATEHVTEDVFDPGPVPAGLRDRAADRGWPVGLVERLWAVRRQDDIEWFLTAEEPPSVGDIERQAARWERLTFGTLRRRFPQESDRAAFADLFAHAREEIDGWEIVVERSPDPFAQFRLQDRVDIRFLEDRGVGMACSVVGGRNCYVAGERLHVAFVQAYRVRDGFRGEGFSRMVTGMDFPAGMPFFNGQVAYVRTRNKAAVDWALAAVPHAVQGNDMSGDVPGTPVEVAQFPARAVAAPSLKVRPATPGDLRRCVELINRTHAGLDLFRPYTVEWFSDRLDQWSWAQKPDWWERIYGWGDFYVAEVDGEVAACGGLWDRGKHMRERWRDAATGAERLIEPTALVDFGHADGRESALAELIRSFVGNTHELGRTHLLAPLQTLPDVTRQLTDLEPVPEVRGLIWLGMVPLNRPYIDLIFW